MPQTFLAPACLRQRAHSSMVLPVVKTSSIRKTVLPLISREFFISKQFFRFSFLCSLLRTTCGSVFFILIRLLQLKGILKNRERWKKSKIVAILIVAFLFWFQNYYRHNLSIEAECCKEFELLIKKWEDGNKDYVSTYLDDLSTSQRPWNPD